MPRNESKNQIEKVIQLTFSFKFNIYSSYTHLNTEDKILFLENVKIYMFEHLFATLISFLKAFLTSFPIHNLIAFNNEHTVQRFSNKFVNIDHLAAGYQPGSSVMAKFSRIAQY